MRRILVIACALFIVTRVAAQTGTQLQPGDAPIASLIAVSPADESGTVTISGAAGAVFPTAQLAIRNLYTGQVVYTQAGITGSFSTQIFGPGNTPFWISPAVTIPNTVRNQPGSLPGGPGTIIYGPFPEVRQQPQPITQLIVDGDLSDWSAYEQAALALNPRQKLQALRNTESLYIGFDTSLAPDNQQKLQVTFTIDGTTYALVLDPRLAEQSATWRRLGANAAELGTVAIPAAQADAIELRIPVAALRRTVGTVITSAMIDQIDFLNFDDSVQSTYTVGQEAPFIEEVDGIVYPGDAIGGDFVRFTASGALAQGAQVWNARGRVQSLALAPGADDLKLQLDVTMNTPDLAESLVGVKMIGELYLQPVITTDGQQAAGGLNSNNGLTTVQTPGGLAIDNLRSDFLLGRVVVPSPQVLRREGRLIFGVNFDLPVPEDLPAGMYVPVFKGSVQIADGEIMPWENNGIFGQGSALAQPDHRLPLVFSVGDVTGGKLIWTLFQDQPSNGSRGLLSEEDAVDAVLSNRIRFNSPTYILPPFANGTEEPVTYPLEPYLLNMLPNLYDSSSAPLLPFLFPGGRLSAQITRPDGTMDDLGNSPIVQNQLSTGADDERTIFGGQSQVDVYRLTTLNPAFQSYQFDQYGAYSISLSGNVEDVWGNRYEGGGTYEVLVAEVLEMTLPMLPGTPFEVGDSFDAGVVIAPGVPADVTITARLYPLDDGDVVENVITGTANRFGYFHDSASNFQFDQPGEYVIDYETRFTDAVGRLWAGSTRTAGVITQSDSALIAHGERGLNDFDPGWRPAWFNTRQYSPDIDVPDMLYPYHNGDVLWYRDLPQAKVQPVITVQDTVGDYQDWIETALPDDEIRQALIREELPVGMTGDDEVPYPLALVPDQQTATGYNYISVVRPGLTIRQYIQGADDGGLPLYWDPNDPLNGQTGAGQFGEAPGDFIFLFGGAVIRNAEADIYETTAYGALGIVIADSDEGLRSRVYPPYSGEAGGPDGGPLLLVDEQAVRMFFHPTGVRPGQTLTLGDTLAISGHVAPTLPSHVHITVTDPDGTVQQFEDFANGVGYFYQPDFDIPVDKVGIWRVSIQVQHEGLTSAGEVHPPYPQGGMLGAVDNSFEVYVVPRNDTLLSWNDPRQDIPIPPGQPYNFNFTLPESWTDIEVSHTVSIPEYIISSGPLPVSGRSFSYQYNLTNLNRRFPFMEIDSRARGRAASDPLTLSFVATGLDGLGRRQILSRSFYIFHDRLLTLQD